MAGSTEVCKKLVYKASPRGSGTDTPGPGERQDKQEPPDRI